MLISEFHMWAVSAHERYNAAKRFLEASKNDPPNEPYRSKYESREILTHLLMEIERKWEANDTLQVKLLRSLLKYEIGVIRKETEEYGTGCELLTTSLEDIRDIVERPECIHLAINILNQLGILWCDRGEIQKAREYLLQAEELYRKYKLTNKTCPFSLEDIFSMEKESNQDWTAFEKTFTFTLYYLAQVFEHFNDNTKSAEYCRKTLKRQIDSGEFEANEWAINCATLSQYFIQEKMFCEARHLLCCAAFILLKYEIEIEKDIEKNKEAWNEVHRSKASLSCCWIKYSHNLLMECLLSKEGSIEEVSPRLIEEEEVLMKEKKVPSWIANYDEAKIIFIFAQNHVSVAQSFFTLNEYANHYAQIVQDHSKLYKGLAFHDPDLSRQCKMHKRRIDLLEDLLSKLNPQFYLSTCRQLQFELGETYTEMMDLKTKVVTSESEVILSVNAVMKINSLVTKGISYFKDFINSLKDRDGKLPEVFSDDMARPALIAHFYIGRNYAKFIGKDVELKLYHFSLSEKAYKFIVKYVEQNPQHAHHVETELPLIKEMIELMPQKITEIVGPTMY